MHVLAEGVTVGRAAADDSSAKDSPERILKECIAEDCLKQKPMDNPG